MKRYPILETIQSPADVKALSPQQLLPLAREIREKLLETVSENGGHLASNLGAVELTIALHRVFDSPRDQIVFDVGHQCYTHKLLTGRYARFDSLRKAGGLSGFCRPNESEHDMFFSGHSSTSVSAGLGLATAKKMQNDPHYVVSVVGDGSFTGGMVYEALNNGGRSGTRHILVLNDNQMSISENVGALAKYLAVIRSTPQYYTFKASTERTLSKIPSVGQALVHKLYDLKTELKNKLYAKSNFFEDLGYRYMGPIDGHRIDILCDALQAAKAVNGPVLLHVITEKGKGYSLAESDPTSFHGVAAFNVQTGASGGKVEHYSDRFGKLLCEFAAKQPRLCAVTAAMGLPTRLSEFEARFPDRFFDVGIAEEHAVTFSGGLAKNGLLPVFAVYSTFLQRCYDQLVHDVALQGVHAVFAVDRAGFVGEDGETHQGLMDVSFLSSVPNFKIYAPCSFAQLKLDLEAAIEQDSCPVAVRYPRGGEDAIADKLEPACFAFSLYGDQHAETAIVTYGRITAEAITAADSLHAGGVPVQVISLNQVKPLPDEALELMLQKQKVFFFEEGLRAGGAGEKTAAALLERGFTGLFRLTAVDDRYVPQGTVKEQLRAFSLDSEGMINTIMEKK